MVNPCYCPKSSGNKDKICIDCGGSIKKEKPSSEPNVNFVKKTDLVEVAKEIKKSEKKTKKKVIKKKNK
jgi:hypothetical protein